MSEITGLHGATAELVLRALDAGMVRHAAHAANIANASVEDYRPLRVSFEDQLAAARTALLGADEAAARRAVRQLEAQVVPDEAGGRVEVDRETALMMQNALRYQALLGALSKNGALLRLAIHEGRK